MSDEEAISVLIHAAKFKLPALLAYAAILSHKQPEDQATIKTILAALIQ